MPERTRIETAPRRVVQAVDKQKVRLNGIAHLPSPMPYEDIVKPQVDRPTPMLGRPARPVNPT